MGIRLASDRGGDKTGGELARFLQPYPCTRRGKRPGAQAGNGTGASHVHCGVAPGPVVGGLPAPFYLRPKEESPAGRAFSRGADVRQVAGTGGIQRFPPDNRHKHCVVPITSINDATGQLLTMCLL